MTIIAIHQPNYIPWTGYFDKIAKSDIFVFFDDVQLPRGKSYVTRNQILGVNGVMWLTVPVKSKSEMIKINETEIVQGNWNKKHWKSINVSYCKAEFFNSFNNEFAEIYQKNRAKICELNVELIKKIAKILQINTKFAFSSEVPVKSNSPSDRIIEIVKYFNADIYISGKGMGSQRYISEEEFRKNNITLIFHEFKHPVYKQTTLGFVPNLSIIDLLFNAGEKAKDFIL